MRNILDLKRVIYGSDNYRLTGQYLKFANGKEDWFCSTIDERNRHFSKLLSATDSDKISERMNRIQSVNGIAKKPGLHRKKLIFSTYVFFLLRFYQC